MGKFNKEVDKKITRLTKKGTSYSGICKKINEKIKSKNNHYNSKQIRQRWKNNLDPNLCHEDLDNNEKEFIIQWAEKHKETRPNGTITIYWKNLIPAMEKKFGKLRSENKIKNFWHSKKRSDRAAKLPPLHIPTKDTTTFSFPPIQPPTTPSLP